MPEGDDLARARFEIARYRGWHASHTLQLPEGSDARAQLAEIDIKALGDFLDDLMLAYKQAGLGREFPNVLDRLGEAIAHRSWGHRVAFQRAFWEVVESDDEDAARAILRGLGEVEQLQDPDFLAFYLDIMREELDFDVRRGIAARIADTTDSVTTRLQYRIFDQIELLKIGEVQKAEQGIRAAIAEFESEADASTRLDGEERGYADYRIGLALQLLGTLSGEPDLFRRAADSLRQSLATVDYNGRGKAGTLREIGICHLRSGDFDSAEAAFRDSLTASDEPLTRVVLAECLLGKERLCDAAVELDRVDWDTLLDHEKFDWAQVSGQLALASEDERRAHRTAERFALLGELPALFERQRHRVVVSLMGIRKPESRLLSQMYEMLEEIAREQKSGGYLMEAIKAETEEIARSTLSEEAREALERKGRAENLVEDRRQVRTRGQRIAASVGRRAAKKLVGEAEDDAVETLKDLVGLSTNENA